MAVLIATPRIENKMQRREDSPCYISDIEDSRESLKSHSGPVVYSEPVSDPSLCDSRDSVTGVVRSGVESDLTSSASSDLCPLRQDGVDAIPFCFSSHPASRPTIYRSRCETKLPDFKNPISSNAGAFAMTHYVSHVGIFPRYDKAIFVSA